MDNPEAKNECMDKLTWQTQEEAGAAAAYARYQYGDGDSKARPYRCRHCDKWHLARSSKDL